MSGRGRGGRGGRGRNPPSGARLLLQRSAKEAGLDDGNLRDLQDITRPKLFPDYEWHSNGRVGHQQQQQQHQDTPAAVPSSSAGPPTSTTTKRSASAVYLMNKSNAILQRFQASPFYVRPSQEADVVRYGKRQQRQQNFHLADDANRQVLEQMGRSADPRYIPPELLKLAAISSSAVSSDSAGIGLEEGGELLKKSLDDLAAEEETTKRRPRDAAAGGGDEAAAAEDGNLSDGPSQEADDEEEDVDYTTNYYASDDESDMGDSAEDEAVF
jgi:hypothetical protein